VRFDNAVRFQMEDVSSYVEQSDSLFGVLTVEETLRFAARLGYLSSPMFMIVESHNYITYSMPPSASDARITKRVDVIIAGLGLSEVRDNRIGTAIQRGISGGQMRRVTVGCSLVTLPRILLLDEPTSGESCPYCCLILPTIMGKTGLDSTTSRQVVQASAFKVFHVGNLTSLT
jgi:ABC-type multidrug transport system ATPase subunit